MAQYIFAVETPDIAAVDVGPEHTVSHRPATLRVTQMLAPLLPLYT